MAFLAGPAITKSEKTSYLPLIHQILHGGEGPEKKRERERDVRRKEGEGGKEGERKKKERKGKGKEKKYGN